MGKDLKKLYMESSKHSNYQILPSNIRGLIDDKDLVINSRFEEERLNYIVSNVDLKNKTVVDIGGNIGFFTFETLNLGAKKVDYYEGNKTHAEFVKEAAEKSGLAEKIQVFPQYYLFNDDKSYDVAYLLNVVHHFGDDFGDSRLVENAKKDMLRCINSMAKVAKILIFQMGFNWCGDRNKSLFEKGTKSEMEDFLIKGTEEYWKIMKIGIAVKRNDRIEYEDINDKNNKREDSLGEFLNRPIFIMESLYK